RRRGPRRRLDVEGAGARRARWCAVARRRGALGKPKRRRRRGRGLVEGSTATRAAATARRRGRWCSSSALVCRGSSTRGVREAEAPASSRAWARRGLNGDEGRGDGSTSRALVLGERAGVPRLVGGGRYGGRLAGVVDGVGSSRAQRRRGPGRRLDVEGAGAGRARCCAVARRRGALGKPKRRRRRGRGLVEGSTATRAAATARRRGRWCWSGARGCGGASRGGGGAGGAAAAATAGAGRGRERADG